MEKIRQITSNELPSLGENGRKAVENMEIKKVGERLIKIYTGTIDE